MDKKALIAMSGGVDSSVAAILLKNMGCDCIGATMKLCSSDIPGAGGEQSCCTEQDIEDAKMVSEKLLIPHYVFDFTDNFREKVIDKFVFAYENGLTPNPCIDCNRHLKFEQLFKEAERLGCECVVTGHYARVEYDNEKGRYLLKKAKDNGKDQSYVLYSLTKEQLSHVVFPLGDLSKAEVREFAEKNGFVNASKKDSQDICFVKGCTYCEFIEKYTNKTYEKGNFIDKKGDVLGTHNGVIRYTIGQRKGLGISAEHPLYVLSVNPGDNTVTLGKDEELFAKSLIAKNINLISVDSIEEPMKVTAKIRYRHKEAEALVWQIDKDTIKVVFNEPQRAITKGQAVVLYDGDTVVGGGVIE